MLYFNDAFQFFQNDSQDAQIPKICDIEISNAFFADHVIVVGFDPEIVSKYLNSFYNYCENKQLQMSLSKTVVLPVGKGRMVDEMCAPVVAGHHIPVVQEFKYLGYWFDRKGPDELHLVKSAAKMRCAANLLLYILRRMGLEYFPMIRTFFSSLVYSQLYGNEISECSLSLYYPITRIFLRRCMGLPHGFPNYPLHVVTGVPEIDVVLLMRRLSYVERILGSTDPLLSEVVQYEVTELLPKDKGVFAWIGRELNSLKLGFDIDDSLQLSLCKKSVQMPTLN